MFYKKKYDSNMHRKANITKCIYVLAYVITTAILSNAQFTANKTDQSISVQTEKIINVHDVSETPTTTPASIPSPTATIDFMNERSNENGNDKPNDDRNSFVDDMINGKIKAGNSNGNNIAKENIQLKSFPKDFDFNLDDLEDLNYHKRETENRDDIDESVTDATTKFEELTLEEESSTNKANYKVVDDNVNRRNVYRVAKNKTKPSVNVIVSDNSTLLYRPWRDGSLKSFQIITEMYDQYRWNIDSIVSNVSNKCGLDMQIYLNALNNEVEWALKGNY